MGSDAGWVGSCWPGDAAGAEPYAQPVVLEGSESVAAALDLLDAQVEALGGPVARAGAVVGEDLALPRVEGLGESDDLGHVVGETAGDGLVERHACVAPALGEVGVADRCHGEPCAEDLVAGVTDA